MSSKTYVDMGKNLKINMFQLLEDRERKFFFDMYSDMKSPPFSTLQWMDEPRPIPKQIQCKPCGGTGTSIKFNHSETCIHCSGKGVPPIPSTELFEPKRRSKAKK